MSPTPTKRDVSMAILAISAVALLWPQRAYPQRFVAPVDNADYGNGYGWLNGIGNRKYHTGIDYSLAGVNPEAERGATVYAAAEGEVVSVIGLAGASGARTGETIWLWDGVATNGGTRTKISTNAVGVTNHGLGMTIIISHQFPDGQVYTLYGHLHSVRADIYQAVRAGPGKIRVAQGEPIGQMGSSRYTTQVDTDFNPHVHFEVKDHSTLGSRNNRWWGYTPDLPSAHGYHDPLAWLLPDTPHRTTQDTVVQTVTDGVLVRSGPGTEYSSVGRLAEGQALYSDSLAESVADADAAPGRRWYRIHIPSRGGVARAWVAEAHDGAPLVREMTGLDVGTVVNDDSKGWTLRTEAAGTPVPVWGNNVSRPLSALARNGLKLVLTGVTENVWLQVHIPAFFYSGAEFPAQDVPPATPAVIRRAWLHTDALSVRAPDDPPPSTEVYQLAVQTGLSFVSVPGDPVPVDTYSLLGREPIYQAEGQPFVFEMNGTSFRMASTVTYGTGYIAASKASGHIPVNVSPRNDFSMPATAGWNLIGAPSAATAVASLTSDPSDALYRLADGSPYVLSYVGSTLTPATSLEPGKAYFVPMTRDGVLTLGSSAAPSAVTVPRAPVPEWVRRVRVVAGDSEATLNFGASPAASPAFDLGLDVPATPRLPWTSKLVSAVWLSAGTPFTELTRSVLGTATQYEWTADIAINTPGHVDWEDPPPGFRQSVAIDGQAARDSGRGGANLSAGAHQVVVALRRSDTAHTTSVALGNFPNPFNPDTWIPFRLATDAHAMVGIYDVAGREVRHIDLGHRTAGNYVAQSEAAHWDGRNDTGELVSSGVYFYRLITPLTVSAPRRLVVSR